MSDSRALSEAGPTVQVGIWKALNAVPRVASTKLLLLSFLKLLGEDWGILCKGESLLNVVKGKINIEF